MTALHMPSIRRRAQSLQYLNLTLGALRLDERVHGGLVWGVKGGYKRSLFSALAHYRRE